MKKVRLQKLISFFLCICLLCALLCGCSGKEKLIDFIYPFSADINSYDPQIAATSDESLIIENTFEGLVRVNDDGTVQEGCAESWEISNDKLTYTFHLKKGLKWNINTEKYTEGENKGEFKDKRLQMLGKEFNPDITANDFVFALRRAVLPETKAPMFSLISGIQGATAIHSGKAAADTLGVTATDDYTLVITLVSPDDNFFSTLSAGIAMPCNEEFFNATKGRYGLDTKYTLFNGQFYVSQILQTSYLLKQNTYYTGPYPSTAGELTLKILGSEEDSSGKKSTVSRLQSGYYDAAFITGSESAQLKETQGITYTPYQDTAWVFLLNTANEVLQSATMREAFCLGLSREAQPEKEYLTDSGSIVPFSCLAGGQKALEVLGASTPTQDIEKSVSLWKEGLKVIDSTDITLTVLTSEEMQNEVREMLQGVQEGIGAVVKNEKGEQIAFTLKVEAVTPDELKNAVSKREYDIALYPYKSASVSAAAFLASVAASNKTGFDDEAFVQAVNGAQAADNPQEELQYLQQAEQALITSYSIYPILCETSYYAAAKGVHGIQFHTGSGRVSFVNATRDES